MFEILLNQQVKEHPTSEAFLQNVAKLLAQADILSQDLGPMRMATYDPSYFGWNQGSDQPAPMEHFYLLPISILYDRANLPTGMPPTPRRAAPDRGLDEIIHLAFTHATKLGNFVAILKEGKLAPSKLHFAESESFFAQGFKVGYTSWEARELGRILHNGTNLSKNECGAIFVGLAWGTGKTVHNGGEGECIDLTSLHELAPLYVQTRFPSSDIDSVRPCHFSIVQACSALILILILRQIRSAGVGS